MNTRWNIPKWACAFAISAIITLAPALGATLLPNGKQQFISGSGVPLANGTVYMYTPATSSCKNTWQDAAQTILNTCPITLDANGEAIIYGTGSYRQQVYACATPPTNCDSSTGLLQWDQLTTDTSASNSVFWAGTATSTAPNVITVTDPGFNGTDGSVIQFIPVSTNTSSVTFNPSGFFGGAPPNIVKDTLTGAINLTGGEIVANSPSNVVSVVYSASQGNFHILNLVNAINPTTPQTLCGALGLKITNDVITPNTKLAITASQVTMTTSGGQTLSRLPIVLGLNLTVNGVNGLDVGTLAASTWYYVYIIANGPAVVSLASLSPTAPTLPSGYIYSCRLGAVSTDSMTTLFRTLQLGSRTVYVTTTATNTSSLPLIASGNTGGGVLATVTGPGAVAPPTATRILVWVSCSANNTGSLCNVAPNSTYTNQRGLYYLAETAAAAATVSVNSILDMVLESSSIAVNSNTAQFIADAYGWEDAVDAH